MINGKEQRRDSQLTKTKCLFFFSLNGAVHVAPFLTMTHTITGESNLYTINTDDRSLITDYVIKHSMAHSV